MNLPELLIIDDIPRPTMNSLGQPIHPTEEGIRNFWKWFGNAKSVDQEGRPLVVFHGTASEFDAFSYGRARSGFFFTDDRKAAQEYADHDEDGDGEPRVISAYLSIQNPLVLDRTWYDENVLEGNGDLNWEAVDIAIADADEAGHDGLILRGFPDFDGMAFDEGAKFGRRVERAYDQYIAHRQEQIKSATGNSGRFDPASPSLTDHETPKPQATPVHTIGTPEMTP